MLVTNIKKEEIQSLIKELQDLAQSYAALIADDPVPNAYANWNVALASSTAARILWVDSAIEQAKGHIASAGYLRAACDLISNSEFFCVDNDLDDRSDDGNTGVMPMLPE